jgi:hypothetical protein
MVAAEVLILLKVDIRLKDNNFCSRVFLRIYV